MGILSRFFRQGEQRGKSLSDGGLDWLLEQSQAAAGVQVSPAGSLSSTTVMACVQLIARSLASVPLVLYRREPDGGRQPATDHPLYSLLHDEANPLQTATEVRETLLLNVLLYGNAYAEIEWGANGYPVALWPLAPDRVGLELEGRRLVYTYYSDEFGLLRLPADRVLHLRGLASSGLVGISPIRSGMNAVGLALATEKHGSKLFSQGARPSLVLSHPAKLTPEAMANLRRSFETQWSGLDNAHRIAVVGEGVKPELMSISPDEAQFLQTREFQVAEICRLFNVAPGLVGAANTQTYASAEQDMIRFRELTLGPWAEAFEKRIGHSLLTPSERRTYFAQHKLAKLQASDLATRYNVYNIAIQAGILTRNEIREMEDYNPVDGGGELWVPLNMTRLDEADDAADPDSTPGPETDTDGDGDTGRDADGDGDTEDDGQAGRALLTALRPLVVDARRRLVARIGNDVRQAGGKALRQGGRAALSEWGETQIHEWRTAGEAMALPVVQAGYDLGLTAGALDVDVEGWVTAAYHEAVRGLTNGE